MPYINVSTSAKIEDKKKLLQEISTLVSSLTKLLINNLTFFE